MVVRVSIQLISLASREKPGQIQRNMLHLVSIQLISLASREPREPSRGQKRNRVSIQLISLASREYQLPITAIMLQSSFHSINFSSE